MWGTSIPSHEVFRHRALLAICTHHANICAEGAAWPACVASCFADATDFARDRHSLTRVICRICELLRRARRRRILLRIDIVVDAPSFLAISRRPSMSLFINMLHRGSFHPTNRTACAVQQSLSQSWPRAAGLLLELRFWTRASASTGLESVAAWSI